MKFSRHSIRHSLEKSSFLLRVPGVLPRILLNYIKAYAFMKPLRTVDITFDYGCVYNCRHCYAHGLNNNNKHILTMKEMKDSIDKCLSEGAIHFNIIGGEPTLNENIFEIIDYIHRKRAIISLATSGFMLNTEFVKRLKHNGLSIVLLSLEYVEEEKQDNFTGYKGSYSRIIEALENIIEVNLPVYISTVITKEKLNSGDFNRLLQFCKKRKILCHVNLPALFGEWQGREDLFFEDTRILSDIYQDRYVHYCETSAYFLEGCTTGLEKLHITAYGDVMPCTFVPISFGNILHESLDTIRQKIHSFPLFNSYHRFCLPSTDRRYSYVMNKMLKDGETLPIDYTRFKEAYANIIS